uniref:Anthranilate synthase component 2 n=1 Tax=Calliarthron tuberculosum TaxID=48942 RepID=M4ITM3_CALTB|nr:anthranilate synthase component II [Calliarthron tuberculosum]AGA63746.1 anthranilate synthase component II [Calliarthron tuberculosum]
MILIIDNYDSFTYNLVQYVGELNKKIKVTRNDKLSIQDIYQIRPSHIIISPGPGDPKESGISLEIIKHFSSTIPILGVCLGHQSIGSIYGGKIKKLNKPMHGKLSKIYHNGKDIFQKLPNPFLATRYHSLIIDNNNLPKELKVTAKTEEGIIMGCQHNKYPLVRGIQFHPESLWTEQGKTIINNFILNIGH